MKLQTFYALGLLIFGLENKFQWIQRLKWCTHSVFFLKMHRRYLHTTRFGEYTRNETFVLFKI